MIPYQDQRGTEVDATSRCFGAFPRSGLLGTRYEWSQEEPRHVAQNWCFFTIALEEVGSVNLTIQFVSKKENVYTMPERISPWVRDQHTDGKWTVLVPCLYLQENSKPMTGTDSGLGFVYQVNNTVKGLKQMVLHQFVIPSDTFSDQGHHLRVHFVQYRPNT